jgi:hypothetical protein
VWGANLNKNWKIKNALSQKLATPCPWMSTNGAKIWFCGLHKYLSHPHKCIMAENRMISGGAVASGLPPIFIDFSAYSFDQAKE